MCSHENEVADCEGPIVDGAVHIGALRHGSDGHYLVVLGVVVLRYGFSISFIWMQEAYVWLHAYIFMMGSGYTYLSNEHVRIDVFYMKIIFQVFKYLNCFLVKHNCTMNQSWFQINH